MITVQELWNQITKEDLGTDKMDIRTKRGDRGTILGFDGQLFPWVDIADKVHWLAGRDEVHWVGEHSTCFEELTNNHAQ